MSTSQQTPFYHDLHVKYIQSLASRIDSPSSYEGAVTEHLRMSGIYWSLTALSLLVSPEEVDSLMNFTSLPKLDSKQYPESETQSTEPKSTKKSTTILDFVFECYDEISGGFGGNKHQDGHMLYTLSAIQILALADCLSDPRFISIRPRVILFIQNLQQDDGSFAGDEWGEVDTRFSYCALSALSIINQLEKNDGNDAAIDVEKAAQYIAHCQNFDGGFGCHPGAESHAGQIFCCVGALSIARRLDLLKDPELLCWWLSERQCDSGGLNGRPEKQADVCYSWWILSSLCILGRVDWIRGDKLAGFICKCQDDEDGGIADRPGDMADVFHTFFGIAGLSLLGTSHQHDFTVVSDVIGDKKGDRYRKIDPIYALPTDICQKLKLKGQIVVMNDTSITTTDDDRLTQYESYNPDKV